VIVNLEIRAPRVRVGIWPGPSLDEMPTEQVGFINSSVHLFGQFLYLFETIVDGDDGAGVSDIGELWEKFNRLDPSAMGNDGLRFWPDTLEDMLWDVERGGT